MTARKVESVESVKELFLNVFLASNELDVVNKNAVRGTVFILELVDVFGAKSSNKFVTKSFGGKVFDFELGIRMKKLPTDSLHQMSFADTDTAPEKKRIVTSTGIFNNTLGGGEGKVVAVANNKVVESIVGMETGFSRRVENRGRLTKKRGDSSGVGLERFLNNKLNGDVSFGLVIESVFEEMVITFLVDVD